MTGLRTVTAEERLLETLRHILRVAGSAMTPRDALTEVWSSATSAIQDYEAAQRVEVGPNHSIVRGEIKR